ncbi:hypothetical protein [Microbispora rosea]|nr:hypothetical protein [Microbispora rosea]GIH46148.1 hypothetical protein Mro03_13270 [Microbispora rosea subsp. rosea]
MSLGREAYDQVADCPDRVMGLPQVVHLLDLKRRWIAERRRGFPWSDEEYPAFELLAYVALDAYKQVTGENVDDLYAAVQARGVRSGFRFWRPNSASRTGISPMKGRSPVDSPGWPAT